MTDNALQVKILNAPAAIICLGEYRPRRFNCPRDRFSQMIRQLKHGSPEAIDYFLPMLEPTLPRGWAVALVPPHTAGPNSGGIYNLARSAASTSMRLDATGVLCRHTTIPKLSFGGTRTERTHFNRIRVHEAYPIQDMHIILLDDVVTTGATKVLPVALAKAVY